MTAVLRQLSATLGTAVLTGYLPTDSWSLSEQAEEGSVGESTVTLHDDASGSLATAFGQLQQIALTDTTGGDAFVWGGYSSEWTWSRGDTVTSRVMEASLRDANYAWGRVVMTGTAASRPAETDVARVQWAMTTHAADVSLDDTTTYISTASPVAMDAADYRGQYLSDLMGDASMASGKNWWASKVGTAYGSGQITAWYGDSNTSTAYSGTVFITNNGGLLATGSAVYAAASQDSSLLVDPGRIFSGAYIEYEGGATYRQSAAIASAYGRRDTTISLPNVKSAAKAQAIAARLLASWATPHQRLRTAVRVGPSLVSQFRPGMRVPVLMTHMPGLEAGQWCRVMQRTVSGRAAGTLYDIEMELVPTGQSSASLLPVYQTVTLDWHNTVMEDADRNGLVVSSGAGLTAGQTWRFTLTNPTHDTVGFTEDMTISFDAVHNYGWGADFGGTSSPPYSVGSYPYPAMPSLTGTYTVTATGGEIHCFSKQNYAPHTVTSDEWWHGVFERLTP